MNDFAILINALDSTNKTSLKQEAIIEFLQKASSHDKLWFLALFTGRKPKRNVNSTLMKRHDFEKLLNETIHLANLYFHHDRMKDLQHFYTLQHSSSLIF